MQGTYEMLRPGHDSSTIRASKEQPSPKNPLFVDFYFILIYKSLFFILDIGILVLLVLELQVVYACMASVNYISPTPSPAIQCRTALHWNRAKNCPERCLDSASGYVVLVANEGRGHLHAPWQDVEHGHLDVAADPLHKAAAVLVLDGQNPRVYLLHGHGVLKDDGHGQIVALARVTDSHHVLGIKNLMGELGRCQGHCTADCPGCYWGEARREEL